MSEHTPEPWTIELDKNDQPNIYGPNGTDHWVALIPHQCVRALEVIANANARRIIACVNACAGLSTEALEGGLLRSLQARLRHATCAGVETWPEYAALAKLEGK